ncbi:MULTISPECIES: hypothetical protein [unclassified Mycolicibacterium]|uniref:hypothetical protein n=1 Tax=unclassified Mycolicibacterium TaxID=2636767 RepID=UPI0012DE173D|nr:MULTISPECIES: hypothetical protein [unclassified Mycolicibacterium]MUL85603.1 hypothetical protein [Mycolicibacterium sp. CBMA 329]MUL88633.1 hypothetical protein [Mycolicibacterium sp. CBMA 331]MUM02072.1 hypothetical protein [Mycolicibacterium sp. CBMA 334]MUM30092.1 hypothetical protein [Mycolicibacterium sp. CBMA 295]MUM40280.1 hypothetical protein [Mycolicibacterium sp. CBMA 247]
MFLSKATLATIAAVGAFGAALGLGAATASADPQGPPPSVPAPAWAPKKPAETWQGQPMVWWNLPAGGHWGVWINGDFLPFT